MSASGFDRHHPLRFAWQLDEQGHFTLDSDEFIGLVGARTGNMLGRLWVNVASELSLDPDSQIARAVATHDTFSGLAVAWPVEGQSETLPVELSGLPVFDRDRVIRGYRGFGVCRDIARLTAFALARQARMSGSRPAVAQAAAAVGAQAGALPATDMVAQKNLPLASDVAGIVAPALNPLELLAFHELSRKLAQGLTGDIQTETNATLPDAADQPHAHTYSVPNVTDALLLLDTIPVRLVAAILDSGSEGAVLIDSRGSILAMSTGAEALLGYGSQELAGRPFTELLAPEYSTLAQEHVREVLDGARAGKRISEVFGRSRERAPLALAMSIAAIAGSKERLCIAFRDITVWKETERKLVGAKQQAEASSSAKSDFLAKISHEIRTPLNSIIGFSEVMLTEQFGGIGNERYRGYLRDIHACGGHLLSLINDLLDLSKIEAGKLELTLRGLALNDLIAQCVASMQPQASRGRIVIRTAFTPALPLVLADARSVRQIVLNLLSNSLKSTPAGGQIIVSTALNGAGEIALRVRDTGVGMSENEIAAALEPFRQLSTSPRGGTGLGLPLTKAMAEANRARFRVTSAPKEGTLIEIVFSASNPQPA